MIIEVILYAAFEVRKVAETKCFNCTLGADGVVKSFNGFTVLEGVFNQYVIAANVIGVRFELALLGESLVYFYNLFNLFAVYDCVVWKIKAQTG